MPLNNRAVAQQCSLGTSQINLVPRITEGVRKVVIFWLSPHSPNRVVQGRHHFPEASAPGSSQYCKESDSKPSARRPAQRRDLAPPRGPEAGPSGGRWHALRGPGGKAPPTAPRAPAARDRAVCSATFFSSTEHVPEAETRATLKQPAGGAPFSSEAIIK